jgi:transposase
MASITLERVVSIQLTEGATDSAMFENFLYHTLLSLRSDESTRGKHIVVLMDNATIHRHSKVLETAKRMHASVLFNAQYSPWINPIELLFNHLKRKFRKHVSSIKK